MPITAEWFDDEKTIIRYVYQGQWTWEDLYKAISNGYAMIDSVDCVVDTIIDLQQSSIVPSSVFSHGRQALAHSHPRQGYMLIVGAHRYILMLYDTFIRIYNRTGRQPQTIFTPTLEDAVRHIEQIHAARQTA